VVVLAVIEPVFLTPDDELQERCGVSDKRP
jgi:hypothetical protein